VPLAAELTDLSIDRLRERRSAKWTFHDPDVLPSWVAEMDFPLAPPIKRALRAAVDRDDAGYSNADGSGLASAVSGFIERRHGWRPDPEQVIACNDVVAGLTDLLRLLLDGGDRVVVTPPVYHPFFSLVGDAGCRVEEVALAAGRDLDLDGIAAAFAGGARAMLLCNPHNPTGTVATREQLESLAAIAAEHDAWILADEIHAPLTLPGAEHIPFLSVSAAAAERGIALVSASKTFNIAGLGCAQIITASDRARKAVADLSFAARHPGHFGTIASEAAYREGDRWLDEVLAVIEHNRALLADLLAEALPEAHYTPPAAGYLAWIDLDACGLGDDPAAPILERGRVAFSSGPMFGSGGEGHIRLNAGTSPDLLRMAVERMAVAIDA
jgi:cystathionine beta-lyase